jgi:ABC-type bacteriocin/lantibiotic exporter with double-glycine peptidase domain
LNVVEREPASAEAEADLFNVARKAISLEPRERKLRPLISLLPYLRRYRGHAAAALAALLLAALATLMVPIAIRRMIDFGFSRESANLIDSYFTLMMAVAAVLALASAARFYLVTALGERIVADLREEMFGISPRSRSHISTAPTAAS